MRKFIVDKRFDGKKVQQVITKYFENMSKSAMHKAFRKKNIKVNGIRVKPEDKVFKNDEIQIFLKDDILDGVLTGQNRKLHVLKLVNELEIVYEDLNLLIVNKQQGIMVHEDDGDEISLIEVVRCYLEGECEPILCHRLDRNTGGLLMIAKNKKTFLFLSEKIREKNVKKLYTCIVNGIFKKKEDDLSAYLKKVDSKGRVFVWDKYVKGSLNIKTSYKVLKEFSPDGVEDLKFSLVRAQLITGRTHQLRAHFAHIGHPILGDGKYGINALNKKFNLFWQCLWATTLEFNFGDEDGILNYLNGKIFKVEPKFSFKMARVEYDRG